MTYQEFFILEVDECLEDGTGTLLIDNLLGKGLAVLSEEEFDKLYAEIKENQEKIEKLDSEYLMKRYDWNEKAEARFSPEEVLKEVAYIGLKIPNYTEDILETYLTHKLGNGLLIADEYDIILDALQSKFEGV